MYKTLLENLEREMIMKIVKKYHHYRHLNEDPFFRILPALNGEDEGFPQRMERVIKRYGLLTQEELEKYDPEYRKVQKEKMKDKGNPK